MHAPPHQQDPPAGAGGVLVAIGEIQFAAARVEAQVQLDFIAGADQLLELEHFHAGECLRQVHQLLAQMHCPLHLHHTGQHRRGGKCPLK